MMKDEAKLTVGTILNMKGVLDKYYIPSVSMAEFFRKEDLAIRKEIADVFGIPENLMGTEEDAR